MPELPPPPPPPLSLAGVLLHAWRRAVARRSPGSGWSPASAAVSDAAGLHRRFAFGLSLIAGARLPALLAGLAVAATVAAAAGWLVLHRLGGGSSPPEITLPRATVPTSGPALADDGAGDDSDAEARGPVTIHAAGAVTRPGVYRLPPGARVADLLQAAGGPTADAEVDALNLAALLGDGQRVYVPRHGELPPGALLSDAGGQGAAASTNMGHSADGRSPPARLVDLNTATLDELESLPGIGPATAEAILGHRRRQGRFRSVDELLEVRGIGPSRLEALRRRVRV